MPTVPMTAPTITKWTSITPASVLVLVRRRLALALAAFEVGDLLVTSVSPSYGPAHLDHLGVPHWVRPALPWIKSGAVVTLVTGSRRPRLRSPVAGALV